MSRLLARSALILGAFLNVTGCSAPATVPQTNPPITDSATQTPTPTLTVSRTATPTASLTPTLTSTPIPIVTANLDWTPVVQSINGTEMVLVPPGCFTMGSDAEDARENEQPVSQQCFDRPFWIDRTEVTNAVFGSSGLFDGGDRPRDTVQLPDAVAFCEAREARLPTEAEWEYAARGPSDWLYPWGNEFNADYAVFSGSAGQQTAPVGSRPEGASWVGAVDMSGNLWEWTTTIYGYDYPYRADDGRENIGNLNLPRAIRGGSWDNGSEWMRASVRKSKHPTEEWYGYVGFRCAKDY